MKVEYRINNFADDQWRRGVRVEFYTNKIGILEEDKRQGLPKRPGEVRDKSLGMKLFHFDVQTTNEEIEKFLKDQCKKYEVV